MTLKMSRKLSRRIWKGDRLTHPNSVSLFPVSLCPCFSALWHPQLSVTPSATPTDEGHADSFFIDSDVATFIHLQTQTLTSSMKV